MRYLVISLLFLATSAWADCSSNGVYTFPDNYEISPNSIFTIEGYARSQEHIRKLDGLYTAYLVSSSERIKLNFIEMNEGMMLLTQALFKPERTLTSGEVYTLRILDSGGNMINETLKKYNSKTEKYEPISWKVSLEEDHKAPKCTSLPKHEKNTYTAFGCGPAVYSIFKTVIEDDSEVLIKTTLKNKNGTVNTTYYIRFDATKNILVGHGMCSGAFSYKTSEQYQVQFSVMDACGNKSQTSDWISFTNPIDDYEY